MVSLSQDELQSTFIPSVKKEEEKTAKADNTDRSLSSKTFEYHANLEH